MIFKLYTNLVLNRVKIQNSKKSVKAKQVNIEEIQINFFWDLAPSFFSFSAL